VKPTVAARAARICLAAGSTPEQAKVAAEVFPELRLLAAAMSQVQRRDRRADR
jgi:hypothetical protein